MASPVVLPAPAVDRRFGAPRVDRTSHRTSHRPVNSPGVRRPPASRRATRTPGATFSSRSQATPVRLTRRGRFVSVVGSILVLGAVVIGAGHVADASAVRTQGSAAGGAPASIVVQSGQTLWGIARDVAPGHDPRLVVSQIRDLNDLGTRPIVPGQELVVPILN